VSPHTQEWWRPSGKVKVHLILPRTSDTIFPCRQTACGQSVFPRAIAITDGKRCAECEKRARLGA